MKSLSAGVFGLTIAACSICVAQVDIYQSDAYSVEEMCAREAEQNDSEDYGSAYENCIEKNRDNSMYQSGQNEPDDQNHADEHSEDGFPEEDVEIQAAKAESL